LRLLPDWRQDLHLRRSASCRHHCWLVALRGRRICPLWRDGWASWHSGLKQPFWLLRLVLLLGRLLTRLRRLIRLLQQ